MTIENNPTKLQEEKIAKIEAELARLSDRIQDVAENFNGQKVRIDRQVGTMDDLLKRFEAWKTVGNEMGEELKVQTNTVVALSDRVIEVDKTVATQANNFEIFKDFLYDLHEAISAATSQLADEDECDSDEPKTEMDVQMERSMEELQNSINASVSTRLDQHEEMLETHLKMLAALTDMAANIKTFVTEVKEILGARLPGEEHAAPTDGAPS